jgi:hypothetical protein
MIKKWNQNNMKECDKWKSHISSKLHVIYISPNNVRHPVIKTFTTLHPSPLHCPRIWLNPIEFSYCSISPHITTLHLTSLHCTFRWLSLHFYNFHVTPFIIAILTRFTRESPWCFCRYLVPVFNGPICKGIVPDIRSCWIVYQCCIVWDTDSSKINHKLIA